MEIPVEGETERQEEIKTICVQYPCTGEYFVLNDYQPLHIHKYVTEHINECAFVGNHISTKYEYNCVYVAASLYTMAITKTDFFIAYTERGKLKVILVVSVRSVTIQAKSGLTFWYRSFTFHSNKSPT